MAAVASIIRTSLTSFFTATPDHETVFAVTRRIRRRRRFARFACTKGRLYTFDIVSECMPDFWATVCETVRPMLSDRCPVLSVCLSIYNVGVLWPNDWMDLDETWRACRPRPMARLC